MKQITVGPATFGCTQREIVVDIARIIYAVTGHSIAGKDIMYLFSSEHPTEKASLFAAEEIFCMFWGDYPDYSDEEEEDDQE